MIEDAGSDQRYEHKAATMKCSVWCRREGVKYESHCGTSHGVIRSGTGQLRSSDYRDKIPLVDSVASGNDNVAQPFDNGSDVQQNPQVALPMPPVRPSVRPLL